MFYVTFGVNALTIAQRVVFTATHHTFAITARFRFIANIAAGAAVIDIELDVNAVAFAPHLVVNTQFFGGFAVAVYANLAACTDVAGFAAVVVIVLCIDADIVNACIGAA